MSGNARGFLLAQYVASGATAAQAYQANSELGVEITRIHVCNTGGGAASVSVFHDDAGGSTFDATTALVWAKSVPQSDFLELLTQGPNGGIHLARGAQIGVTDSSSGDLTVSIYGVSEEARGSSTRT